MTAIRITPAYAGKSSRLPSSKHPPRDHPRLCGEKLSGLFFIVLIKGSPPPMRGKAQRPYKPHGARGITPAYAGKRY